MHLISGVGGGIWSIADIYEKLGSGALWLSATVSVPVLKTDELSRRARRMIMPTVSFSPMKVVTPLRGRDRCSRALHHFHLRRWWFRGGNSAVKMYKNCCFHISFTCKMTVKCSFRRDMEGNGGLVYYIHT